jgi:hypothetical protein
LFSLFLLLYTSQYLELHPTMLDLFRLSRISSDFFLVFVSSSDCIRFIATTSEFFRLPLSSFEHTQLLPTAPYVFVFFRLCRTTSELVRFLPNVSDFWFGQNSSVWLIYSTSDFIPPLTTFCDHVLLFRTRPTSSDFFPTTSDFLRSLPTSSDDVLFPCLHFLDTSDFFRLHPSSSDHVRLLRTTSWVVPHVRILPTISDYTRLHATCFEFFRSWPTSCYIRLRPASSDYDRLLPNTSPFPASSDFFRLCPAYSDHVRLFLNFPTSTDSYRLFVATILILITLKFFRPPPISAENALLTPNASANVRLLPTTSNFYHFLNACDNFRLLTSSDQFHYFRVPLTAVDYSRRLPTTSVNFRLFSRTPSTSDYSKVHPAFPVQFQPLPTTPENFRLLPTT